ncbi:MAG: amino acid adenylation domain-containing protein [Variovorax sp.]|nr:MAG: amino acid adenylation domain-containing protein [Variovorax sp.]
MNAFPDTANTPHSTSMNDADAQDFDPFALGAIARVVPTTEAQREVWLAHQLGREAALSYNESVDLRLDGALDTAALTAAFNALLARHDALRSTFSADGTQLLVAEPSEVALPLHDLSELDEGARARTMAHAHAEAVETPFDLEQGPLLRATLYRHAPAHHVLLMTAHHAVCDGWSWGVIAEDLGRLYAEQIGEGPALDAAPSYGAYADWERAEAATPQAQAQLAYWLGRYPGHTTPTLDLPLDRPRAARRRFEARRTDMLLPATLVEAARRTGAATGASLFATLFTVFAALMQRLSQQDDLVIGVPAAGQAASDMPRLVGHCVNLLPIRVALDAASPFDTVLQQVGSTLLDAFDHQTLTYGTLLKKLPVARDPSRPSLVSVMFNLDRATAAQDTSFPDVRSTLTGNPRHFDNFELFLNAVPVAEGLMLELQYNTALFDESTVRRWLALYREALAAVARAPSMPVADAIGVGAEDSVLLDGFNATAAPFDADVRIDTLITRQAAATPDAVAVRAGDATLSYRDLDQRANALAIALQSRGIGMGDLVGLCCARNEHMLVALLGILKSGAGYVPLDPSFPRERLDFMIADAAVRVAVTDAVTDDSGPLQALDRVRADLQAPSAETPRAIGTAGDVAYLIYTSGSTGRPKGVRVPHRTVVNLLTGLRTVPGIDAQRRVLAVTTLSFDIAVSEVILPLTVGARIVVADKLQALQGDRLRELIETEEVDFVDATPSTWRILLDAGWPGRRDLLAICTGEPLPADLARQLLPMVGELWNGYGPTETTVWSSFHRVLQADGVIPIGRPVINTQFHVLDSQMRPLPVGVTGELYIGGAGVTLGYLNRPELTDERFVPAPGRQDGTRWYRTGDLGRWRADGVLECLGRADHQVKVRGYRIELGEIEAHLVNHPQVERALVVTREDQPGNVRIVAYVISRGSAAAPADLKRHLGAFLPDYMLPQHFVLLDAFPLLPNGKVDRMALPAPRLVTLAERPPPASTEFEREIAAAMQDVLSLGGMDMNDDFFALGGHSLLAARLTMKLSRQLGVKVPMSTLFEAPTPARMAAALERLLASGRSVVAAETVECLPGRITAPLTPIQEWMRFMEDLHPGRSDFNAPSAHRFTGPLDTVLFRQALQEIVRRQSALRTCIRTDPATGAAVQHVTADIEVQMPVIDLSALPVIQREAELGRHLQALANATFDVQTAPLFRFTLLRMGAQDHAFIFVPHHLIWDGWSFDLFQNELSTIYRALVEGRAHGLPALGFTYGDYAAWYVQWLQQPEALRQITHWKQRFGATPPAAALPTDRERPAAGMTGGGATLWIQIDAHLTERLREVARMHDVTLNMLTLSVYALLLADLSPRDMLVVATPVRAREVAEAESVMGFFNNMLPIPLQLNRSLSLEQFTAYVKGELMAFMDYQMVPFARLLEEPEFADRFHDAGLYQALFSFQDARARPTDIGGLGHRQLAVRQNGAADDLSLWLMDKHTGIEGVFTYNTDLYLAATGEAIRDRYVELLARVAASPRTALSELLAEGGSRSAAQLMQLKRHEPTPAPPRTTPPATKPVDVAGSSSSVPALSLLMPEQAELAQVWAGVLQIDVNDIRASDNFFDLGGDSLLAMRVLRQAEQVMGFKVEARRYVFESLAQLASSEAARPATATAANVSNAPTGPGEAPRTGLLGRMFGWGRKG